MQQFVQSHSALTPSGINSEYDLRCYNHAARFTLGYTEPGAQFYMSHDGRYDTYWASDLVWKEDILTPQSFRKAMHRDGWQQAQWPRWGLKRYGLPIIPEGHYLVGAALTSDDDYYGTHDYHLWRYDNGRWTQNPSALEMDLNFKHLQYADRGPYTEWVDYWTAPRDGSLWRQWIDKNMSRTA